MYVGESSFDENGNQIGFVMKNPGTYGFDIKKECISLVGSRVATLLIDMLIMFVMYIWGKDAY